MPFIGNLISTIVTFLFGWFKVHAAIFSWLSWCVRLTIFNLPWLWRYGLFRFNYATSLLIEFYGFEYERFIYCVYSITRFDVG